MTNIKLDRYDQVSITLLLIILVVSALDMLSGRLRLWVLEGKMSVWHMQPDLAASRRQHKQLYQVRALPALRRAGGASLPALLRLVFLQFGISGEQLTTGLQQIGRYRRGCSSGTTSELAVRLLLRKSASPPPSSSPGR